MCALPCSFTVNVLRPIIHPISVSFQHPRATPSFSSGPTVPAHTRRLPDVGSMLERRRRRRANVEPTLGKRLVFAG